MNKKVVIIVVLVECIMAVLLISFFGQAIYNNYYNVECNEVYFTHEDGTKVEDDVYLEVELSDTNLSYQLYWAIEPSNAANKKVTFISSKPEYVIVSQSGLVTFLVETDVTIVIKTLDGGNKTDSILLVPKRNTSGDVDI